MSRHQAKRQLRLSTRRKLHFRWCGPACFPCGPQPVCCCPSTRLTTARFPADMRWFRAQTVGAHLEARRTLSFLSGCFLCCLAPGLGRGGCAAMAGRLLGVVRVAAGAISRLVHRGPGVAGVLAEGAVVCSCNGGGGSCSTS